MKNRTSFNENDVLHELKHYLPAQAPLKDFIHHNTLHAFQTEKFALAIRRASKIFGYKVSLSIDEYRELFEKNRIRKDILEKVILDSKGKQGANEWTSKLLQKEYNSSAGKKIGKLRAAWKNVYHIDLDTIVHTNLFRILNSYLDQGIAISKFPVANGSFLSSIKELERDSFVSFFKTRRARNLLFSEETTLKSLLQLLVGKEELFEQYLFDQQFAHPGWSGLVGVLEDQPQSLLDTRSISLRDFILVECLLEIDNLENIFGRNWRPLGEGSAESAVDLFGEEALTELDEVLNMWQQAYEWSYYDEVLAGIMWQTTKETEAKTPSFQAFFCIDDRECSIRRYVEQLAPEVETFGTPGHFGIDTFYQPDNGKFYTKVCPAPVTPKHLIKEISPFRKRDRDLHFEKNSHGLFRGWLISQTLGFWSALKLAMNIFRPSIGPASSHSFRHMDKFSSLLVENKSPNHRQDGLQVGYSVQEMADRVEGVLKSTGLVKNFSPLVYMVGHGASSANNTHYAGYDCGACSGRPGSVNARAFSYMANHVVVRELLAKRGIVVPVETEFLGALHDTTSDEIAFYDEQSLSPANQELHKANMDVFARALDLNAKERSRRFVLIDTKQSAKRIHDLVRKRSVSLFEPRPELNHATNALCIVGRRWLSKGLFLDRRSFLNSYDYRVDLEGKFLLNILNAAAPVCGGINLEYYFSRVDNEKLGAGSKLPHNVMGLIGVANGFEGDLRPGLPLQMIEVHDPVRLLMIIEHFPEVVLNTVQSNPATYEWFIHEWVILAVVHPETRALFVFSEGKFSPYEPLKGAAAETEQLNALIESEEENFPVYQLK